jgi:hypothetical protein
MGRRKLIRIFSSWLFIVGTLTALMVSLSAVHDLGVFELEGDAFDDPAVLGDDWSSVNGSGGTPLAKTGVLSDPGNATIFTGGGSKDPIDISGWRHKDASGGLPDKDNITNAYAAAYNVNNELIIYFGADRYANSGDAQLGFWFFQQNVSVNADGTFNGIHTIGDILVLANFSNGGSTVTIQVLEWVGSGGEQPGGTMHLLLTASGAQCGAGLSNDLACAISNALPTASPWPYVPKSGTPNVFPQFSFFEGGINLTRIFEGSTPPCFASFMAETRSSTSVNAVLKDFVVGAFPVCGINITKTCPSSSLNSTETAFVYNFQGTVTNTGFGTLHDVTVVDDAGTPGNTSDDITFNIGTLGPQASANFSGSFESTQNPATNTARVSASLEPGGPVTVTDISDPAPCPPVIVTPHISVTKACETRLVVIDNKVVVRVNFAGQVCAGDQVGLQSVTVTDDSGTPNNPADDQVFAIGSLAKSECKPYSGFYLPSSTFSDIPSAATFTDTVTARGTAPLGGGQVQVTRTATCPICP